MPNQIKMTIRDWILGVPVLFTWFILETWNMQYRNAEKRQDGQAVEKLKNRLHLAMRLSNLAYKITGGEK